MTESPFDLWSTSKLGQMIKYARRDLAEAQAAFAQSGAEERRLRKRTYSSERAEQYLRRAEDTLALMRAELRRRAIESTGERRKGERKGEQFRKRVEADEADPVIA